MNNFDNFKKFNKIGLRFLLIGVIFAIICFSLILFFPKFTLPLLFLGLIGGLLFISLGERADHQSESSLLKSYEEKFGPRVKKYNLIAIVVFIVLSVILGFFLINK